MGYIAGVETGMAALASDFRKTVPEDYQNTPIDELPILNNISGAKNFVLVIDTTGGTDTVEQFIRQWYTPYGVKYAGILTAGIVPAVMAYYPKQMFAYLYGARGGAEYELLVRIPGKNLMMTDAISIAHVFFFVFVLLANIGYIGDKLSKNKKEDGRLKQ
jgi:translation elongation factor EF-1beta